MALMIPDLTVEEVEREHGSNAEARIYAAIRDDLGPEYTVLYSVAWLEKGAPPPRRKERLISWSFTRTVDCWYWK